MTYDADADTVARVLYGGPVPADHLSAPDPSTDSRFVSYPVQGRARNEKTTPSGRHFQLVTAAEFLNESDDDLEWVVDRLFTVGGIVSITAKPKVGKSTLARALALSVARGLPFLGRETSRGTAIYLGMQEQRGQVRGHLRAMGMSDDDPVLIHTGAAPADTLGALRESIETHRPAVVIIDNLFSFARVKDASAYAEVNAALEPVMDVARTTRTLIVFTHHHRKGEAGDGDAILGSSSIFGAVDHAVMLRKRPDGKRVASSQARTGDVLPDTVFELASETGWPSITGTVEELERDTVGKRIVAALQESPELSEDQLCENVGGNRATTRRVLRDLLASGEVRRIGRGIRGNPYTYLLPRSDPSEERTESEHLRS